MNLTEPQLQSILKALTDAEHRLLALDGLMAREGELPAFEIETDSLTRELGEAIRLLRERA